MRRILKKETHSNLNPMRLIPRIPFTCWERSDPVVMRIRFVKLATWTSVKYGSDSSRQHRAPISFHHRTTPSVGVWLILISYLSYESDFSPAAAKCNLLRATRSCMSDEVTKRNQSRTQTRIRFSSTSWRERKTKDRGRAWCPGNLIDFRIIENGLREEGGWENLKPTGL